MSAFVSSAPMLSKLQTVPPARSHSSCTSVLRTQHFDCQRMHSRVFLSRGLIVLSGGKKKKSKSKKSKKSAKAMAAEESSPVPSGTAKGPLVVIDNYDSFTYNLCQYIGSLGCEYVVFKNDEKTVEEVRSMNPAGILVSPGPGEPQDSGISLQVCKELGPDFPLFGVCMGHQCIGEAFGGTIVRAPTGLMHGKQSPVNHTDTGVLTGLPSPFAAARYHSLVIAHEGFPEDELEVTATTEDGTIMAVQHRRYPHIQGVQFHPESVITDNGMDIVANFIKVMERGVIDLGAP